MRPHLLLFACTLAILSASASATPPDWGSPAIKRPDGMPPKNNTTPMFAPHVDDSARWAQVPGCARDIVGGMQDVIYVTGCDVVPNSHGSSQFYRWNGSSFVPFPVAGHGSAIATYGFHSYTIGGDALLYSRSGEGEWQKRGTPDGRPITDVGAGKFGLWVVTARPNGEGGNAIARAMPCANGDRLLPDKDFCGWEEMPGAAVRISVGNTAWVVNAQGQIFEWQDNAGGYWLKRPGCFRDVAANGSSVYAVGCKRGNGDGNAIYRWTYSGWSDAKGAGKRVAVDAMGYAWAITDSGDIWRRVP
ncbi:MAG: hypothetical protein JNM58_15505 [Xanthomonadaceae bacterium]|nr:hypothetical protein [Xanthomonadaceae bacterium]